MYHVYLSLVCFFYKYIFSNKHGNQMLINLENTLTERFPTTVLLQENILYIVEMHVIERIRAVLTWF